MTERWLVALDVDGTILHEDETLSPHVVDAIQAARDAGHEVTLSTGRAWEHTKTVLSALELSPEYVVCANGAVIMKRDDAQPEGYRRELVETFDPMPVLRRIREALPGGRFMVEDAVGRRFYTEGMFEWNLDGAAMVDFDGLGDIVATRVVCVSPDHSSEEFLGIVESAGLHQVSYSIGWTGLARHCARRVNKGTACERMREWLGIPLAQVLVAGDGRNDIEMFEWARRGWPGRGNGPGAAEVIAVATEVTKPVTEDGLVAALAALPRAS